MNLGMRMTAVVTMLVGAIGIGAMYAPSAVAEAPLPYVAFGVGLGPVSRSV